MSSGPWLSDCRSGSETLISWIAYVLNLVAIVLVYHGLFRLFQLLYRRNRMWAVSLAVFISPFAYILFQVKSPLELMWVLLLTPFYAVTVLMILATSWMIRYYSTAYIILAVLSYFIQKRKAGRLKVPEGRVSYHVFWQRKGMACDSTASIGSRFSRLSGFVSQSSSQVLNGIGKYWSIVKVIALIALAATTFLVGAEPKLRDPAYQEVLQFVASDRTELNTYAEGSYACARFAADFKSNAVEAGYNCGYVFVIFPDSKSHALNAFNTTDRGLVFIEPQSDAVMTLKIGQPYWDRANFSAPDYNDTVTGYTIDW